MGRGRAEQIAGAAIARAHRVPSTRRRLAVAVSTTAFALVALTGVGVAADHSVPGDPLYSVDRALESVGLGGDVVEERLQEAIVLASRGDASGAATTASEAISEINRRGVTPKTPPESSSLEPVETTTTEASSVSGTTQMAESAPSVEAEATPVDSAEAIRLAAEQLLRSVRIARSDPTAVNDVESAVVFLAEATATVEGTGTSTTTSSTSTTTSSTTTTTLVESGNNGNGKGNGGDADTETTTTTTTVVSNPDEGSGATSPADGGDGSSGPIFLPTP